MIGDIYELFGTGTSFEITGEGKTYWAVTVRSSQGQELRVRIEKPELADGVKVKKLTRLEKADAPVGS
jgi:hypothetical protein